MTQDDVGGEKQKGMVLFASIRRLNRLSHLYCKDTREQTQEVAESVSPIPPPPPPPIHV